MLTTEVTPSDQRRTQVKGQGRAEGIALYVSTRSWRHTLWPRPWCRPPCRSHSSLSLSSFACFPSHIHMDTHNHTQIHTQHTHSHTWRSKEKGKKKTKREGRWKKECERPEGSSRGGVAGCPALSGQETSWLPLFPSQPPKVSSGGSATCSPPTPLVRSCETRTKDSSTRHCLPESSLMLHPTSPLQPRASS